MKTFIRTIKTSTMMIITGAVALLWSGSSWGETVNPADHVSAATAVKVHTGDTITLPALSGSASYTVLNKSFLSLSGTTLTALKPGIVGVLCTNSVGEASGTMAVLVLPEKIDNGNIYIWSEKASGNDVWCTASSWLNVDGTAATDFPKNEDDIAIIPHYDVGTKSLKLGQDITLGGIYAGRFNAVNADMYVKIIRTGSTTPTLTFKRSDDEPVIIQTCGNCVIAEKRYLIYFGDSSNKVNFNYASDTVFDGGWDGINSKYAGGRPSYPENCTNTIPAGVTLTWRNVDSTATDRSSTFSAPLLAGAGTIWNRSSANIVFSSSRQSDAFTGLIRDSSHGNKNIWRTGPCYFKSAAVTNASAEACGFVYVEAGAPKPSSTSGAGMLNTGYDHTYEPPAPHPGINWLPAAGLRLVNSVYFCGNSQGWSAGDAEYKYTRSLTAGRGFSYVYRNSNTSQPINWFETDALVHQDKGTIRVDDYNRSEYGTPQTTTNNVTEIHGISSHLVGGTGDPLTSENYPIIPWMVTPSYHSNSKKLAFTCFDGEDRICDMMTRTSRTLDSVTDAQENVYVNNQSIKLTANRTVNSLWLYNPSQGNGAKNFGSTENTLTVTSGGVILSGNGSGLGTQDRPTENGKLVLGNASHPGYVFYESTSSTAPNGIYAEVTAPGGLVFGYTGYALLAGNQTGIDDELVVNAGTLDLGSQDKAMSCTLDVPVRVLANATVKMNNVSMDESDIYFDDIAGYCGKVQLNADARCNKLFVRDTPEETEWTSLAAGTYGATGSGAANIDDEHFAGTGVLTVSASGPQGGPQGIVIIVE